MKNTVHSLLIYFLVPKILTILCIFNFGTLNILTTSFGLRNLIFQYRTKNILGNKGQNSINFGWIKVYSKTHILSWVWLLPW